MIDEEIAAEYLDRLRELDSCAVSDALDTLGVKGAVSGVLPLWPSGSVVGRARTVQVGLRQADGPADHVGASAIESSGPSDVLVIANNARTDVSCFGGILARAAVQQGIEGVLIDGACRDVSESEQIRFPVFARAVVPISARGRIVQTGQDEPVEFGGVTVRAEDLLIADRNGVAFIPADKASHVITMAEAIAAREEGMDEAVVRGTPVTSVMHDSKFPTLKEIGL